MDYEFLKEEFIKLKKEELDYIDNISKLSKSKKFTEYEKIEIYRKLKSYEIKINEMYKLLVVEFWKYYKNNEEELMKKDFRDIIIVEFVINKDFLSSIDFSYDEQKEYVLSDLGIDLGSLKFELTLYDLSYGREYQGIEHEKILNGQRLIEKTIYVFCGYLDTSEDCIGPCLGEYDDYIYGMYKNICSSSWCNNRKEINKNDMCEFEKDKTVIHSKKYTNFDDVKEIFEDELLNVKNNTLDDCIRETQKRVDELSYIRSPEYKEKVLVDRINDLYKSVKGEFIKKEVLYSGNFLDVLNEVYELPNGKIVNKEKIVKNKGKDSVIVIAINQDKEYIITFQNRIKDTLIAEFPAGYIEDGEDVIDAAKRELMEETGYVSDDLFIVDEAYSAPGIDNSTTYIVVANNCIKSVEKSNDGTEFVNYGVFSEKELKYLIASNIIKGAMNKLAYYTLAFNTDNCNIHYTSSNKKIYKKEIKKEEFRNILL